MPCFCYSINALQKTTTTKTNASSGFEDGSGVSFVVHAIPGFIAWQKSKLLIVSTQFYVTHLCGETNVLRSLALPACEGHVRRRMPQVYLLKDAAPEWLSSTFPPVGGDDAAASWLLHKHLELKKKVAAYCSVSAVWFRVFFKDTVTVTRPWIARTAQTLRAITAAMCTRSTVTPGFTKRGSRTSRLHSGRLRRLTTLVPSVWVSRGHLLPNLMDLTPLCPRLVSAAHPPDTS